MRNDREFKIRMASVRQNFRMHLENICKDCITDFDHLTIEWNPEDTEYMTDAKTVTVYYRNGYSKCINVAADSFAAIVMDVMRWAV